VDSVAHASRGWAEQASTDADGDRRACPHSVVGGPGIRGGAGVRSGRGRPLV